MDVLNLAKMLSAKYQPSNVDHAIRERCVPHLSQSIVPADTLVMSGSGSTLHTTTGEVIDFASMTYNCILGQNDPWVNANIAAYLLSGRPSFVSTRLGSELYYSVANRILSATKNHDFVINHRQCNGSDVTELAVFAAYSERTQAQTQIVSFKSSYHGQNLTAYHISGMQRKFQFLNKTAPVVFLDQPTNCSHDELENELTDHDKNILDQLEALASSTFALIMEPIQVNNSVNTPSKKFIREIRALCTKYNVALIFDEVQTGFGWLGTMTASEQYSVTPDLLALSKSLTAGYGPFAALIGHAKYRSIPYGAGAKTNGADVRALVACGAVIDRLVGIPENDLPQDLPDDYAHELRNGLLSQFNSVSNALHKRLETLRMCFPENISSINGIGLIRGIELMSRSRGPNVEKARQISEQCLEHGVLLRNNGHTLIFKPPLVTSTAEFDRGFAIIEKVIKKVL